MRRLSTGGLIDRDRPLRFRWDDRELVGFAGDTLASALLANGQSVLGPSVSFGRPRGVMAAGFEEAHGFAQIGDGGASEPLVRMSSVPLHDGLVARSRTTKGYLPNGPDATWFDKRFGHCDLLVVGGGPAGIAAALVGARAGARVMLVEHEPILGGGLRSERRQLDGAPASEWVTQATDALGTITVLTGTTASMALDQNGMIMVQRLLGQGSRGARPEKRLWHVRAKTIVLATGALERPIVFQDNDRPGIMLARAARTYCHRFGLVPDRPVLFTATDDGYRTALEWHAAGVATVAIVDPRNQLEGALAQHARDSGIRILTGTVVTGTSGHPDGTLQAIQVSGPAGDETIPADLLAVSGGYDPALGLHQQLRGATVWDEACLGTVPAGSRPNQWIAGAAAGRYQLGDCLADGAAAARAAIERLGLAAATITVPLAPPEREAPPAPLWRVPAPDGDETRSFVDPHRDATVAGLDRALGSGLRHIEHIKRYTLIGTGVEQGRAAKVNAGVLAALGTGRPIADVGTSNTRPPVEPMLFHAVAGRATGGRFEPIRTTAIHPAHVAAGAVFEQVGQWLRPRYFPRAGETMADATLRECRAAREAVAMIDVSTLGKIDIQGPDAARFLDRLYVNPIGSLEPGKARYGVMCRQDGIVFDDGVVMRLTPERFFVTTTTGNAAAVLDWMEEWLQTEWRDLRVWAASITEEWSTVAVVGPRARAVLGALAPDLDGSNEAFPFMAIRSVTVAGRPNTMVARVSFSGELAYEISVPRPFGLTLWEAIAAAGQAHGITAYGLEALHVLRAEKGYFIVGQESDATTTPADLGLGRMVSKKKDFLGKRSLARPALTRPGRPELVGFLPVDPRLLVPEGAAVLADPEQPPPRSVLGHVTASHHSAALGRSFGLAMVAGGFERRGQTVHAYADGRVIPITLCDAVLYDPEGAKRDG